MWTRQRVCSGPAVPLCRPSMRKQNRQLHVLKNVACDTAENELAETRLSIGAHDQQLRLLRGASMDAWLLRRTGL